MNFQKVKLNRKKTGSRIANAILSSDCTFDEVAKALELKSGRAIYYWINGKKLPSLENIINLAKMFNLKIEDLVVID